LGRPMAERDKTDLTDIYIEKFATLITSAFALVAALAWNDTIKAIINEVFGKPDAITPMVVYALIVTGVAVLATHWIGKIAEKAKDFT